LSQTVCDLEILVVDDHSTQDIGAALTAFNDGRVRLIRHDVRRGAAAARNTGVHHACGSYLAFLDSDDEWLWNKLEMQLRYMRACNGEVCCTSFFLHRNGGQATTPPRVNDAHAELLLGCGLSPGSTLVSTRTAFSRVGPFSETLARLEDWDWLLRCRLHYKILVMPIPLTRVHLAIDPANSSAAIEAAEIIRSRRTLYGISIRSPIALMKFESTILMEKSAAAYHAEQVPRALYWGLLCLMMFPFRNIHFFKRRAGNLLALLGRIFAGIR
jgi:glycosyltransferase involved in cell wall biosynthesis